MNIRTRIGYWSAVVAVGLWAAPRPALSATPSDTRLGLTDPRITVQMVNPYVMSNLPRNRDLMTVEDVPNPAPVSAPAYGMAEQPAVPPPLARSANSSYQSDDPNIQGNLPEDRDRVPYGVSPAVGLQPVLPRDLPPNQGYATPPYPPTEPVANDYSERVGAIQIRPGDLISHNAYGSNTRGSRSSADQDNPPPVNGIDNRAQRARAREQERKGGGANEKPAPQPGGGAGTGVPSSNVPSDASRPGTSSSDTETSSTSTPAPDAPTPGTTAPGTTAPDVPSPGTTAPDASSPGTTAPNHGGTSGGQSASFLGSNAAGNRNNASLSTPTSLWGDISTVPIVGNDAGDTLSGPAGTFESSFAPGSAGPGGSAGLGGGGPH